MFLVVVVVVLIAGEDAMEGEPRSSERQTRCSWLSERCEFNTTPKDPPHRLV